MVKQLINHSFKLKINKLGKTTPGLGLIKIDVFITTSNHASVIDLPLTHTTDQYNEFLKTQNPQIL